MRTLFRSAAAVAVCAALCTGRAAASDPSYPAVKAAVQDLKRHSLEHPRVIAVVPFGDKRHFASSACWAPAGCVVLGGCSVLETYVPSAEDGTLAAKYALIADVAVTYARTLTGLHYPASVWQPAIRSLETYEVGRAKRSAGSFFSDAAEQSDAYKLLDEPFNGLLTQRLTTTLTSYARLHPALRGLVFEGGCGGGEVPIKIVTSPLAAQLFIIPTFFYDVCRAQGVKPDDRNACSHWREVLAPVENISGSYHYFVRWAGGVARSGTLNVNDVVSKGEVGTITLRRP